MTQITDILTIAQQYMGAHEGDTRHSSLIDAFNRNFRGYTLSYNEAWCAAGLSAFFILAGHDALIPIECSVVRMYSQASRKGMTCVGRAGGRAGDIVFYDWDDDSIPDHVGIISAEDEGTYHVIECNKSDAVGERVISKGEPCIYAVLRPAYSDITHYPEKHSEAFRHTYYAKVQTSLALREGPGPTNKMLLVMGPGDLVDCAGSYTLNNDTPWLYVTHEKTGERGYCTLYYLRIRGEE